MREESIFIEALEKGDAAERAAFLNRACAGDEALRRRVERLLLRHHQADSLLDPPAPTVDLPPGDSPGAVVGPYKLIQLIGEGGMGTVYMAEQTAPVRRLVALKLIRAGMDSRQVLARFEAERQALALMDHPNIAKVLDAGTTEQGRPYFVMELVKGSPITRFCDERRLTPGERLGLFIPVCQAVQHAHQKGVIHRDIKPTNVLVALYDGVPVPKVIDFGVAKATGQKLTERTLYTEYGSVIGTLEYMSPEQAELNQLDVDTRSDIYSLGVLLYELLTGTTPLQRKQLEKAAVLEALRLIREEEPPRPSTRLGTTEELPGIAACRGVEPRRLTGLLRGELDWVVMKALEKDRNRRYETANGLAMDLQRYLADEPVLACPPSAAYRLRKLVRRHKAALATTLLVALALVLSTIVLAVSNVRIAGEKVEKEKALLLAKENERKAEEHRKQAEANLGEAMKAVDQMLTRVGEERLAQIPHLQPVRRALLEDAVAFYQRFLRDNSTDPTVRFEAGKAWSRVGALQGSLGRVKEAGEAFRHSIGTLEDLVREFPDHIHYSDSLGDSYFSYTIHLMESGRHTLAGAEPVIRKHLALRERWTARLPDDLWLRRGLGNVLMQWGYWLKRAGRPSEAEGPYRRAMDVFERIQRDRKDGPRWEELGDVIEELAGLLQGLGRDDEAEAIARRGLSYWTSPRPVGWTYSRLQHRLGSLLQKRGRQAEAVEAFREAARATEQEAIDTGFPFLLSRQAGIERDLAHSFSALKAPEKAERSYARAIGLYGRVLDDLPGDAWNADLLRVTCQELVDLLLAADRQSDATRIWRDAIEAAERLVERVPGEANLRRHLGELHLAAGRTRERLGVRDEAVRSYERSAAALRTASRLKDPEGMSPEEGESLLQAQAALARALRAAGRTDEASEALLHAAELAEGMAASSQSHQLKSRVGDLYDELAWSFIAPGRVAGGDAFFRRAVERSPSTAPPRVRRATFYCLLGLWDRAKPDLDEALKLRPHVGCRQYLTHALVALDSGDLATYRALCARLPKEFDPDADWAGRENELLRAVVLRPVPEVDAAWALRLAERAVARDPNSGWHQLGLGIARHLSRDEEGAIAALRRSLETNHDQPQRAQAYPVMALAYHRLGRDGEARKALAEADRAIDEERRTQLRWWVGGWPMPWWDSLCLRTLQGEAKARIDAAGPSEDTRWLAVRARALAALGDREAARAAIDRLAGAESNDPFFHTTLAWAHRELEEWAAVRSRYEAALRLDPGKPLRMNMLAWLLATCPDEAVRDARRAVELAVAATGAEPERGTYWNTLGVAKYRVGDDAGAITALAKSIELTKGGDAFDFFFLATAHHRLGHHAEARGWYGKAVAWMEAHRPDDEELRRFRAEAERLMGPTPVTRQHPVKPGS